MATAERLNYLERRFATIKKVKMRNPNFDINKPESARNKREITTDVETKYRSNFEKYASYLGHGVYQWRGATATDTRELFLLVVLRAENVKFKEIPKHAD